MRSYGKFFSFVSIVILPENPAYLSVSAADKDAGPPPIKIKCSLSSKLFIGNLEFTKLLSIYLGTFTKTHPFSTFTSKVGISLKLGPNSCIPVLIEKLAR